MLRTTALLVACLTLSSPSYANNWTISLAGGFSKWPDTSNNDEVEADEWQGYQATIEGGYERRRGNFSLRSTLDFSYRNNSTHGRNEQGRRSGEGDSPGHVYSFMLNLRPGYYIHDDLSLNLLTGGGGGCATFFSKTDCNAAFQGGVGGSYNLYGSWEATIEWRSFFLLPTSHRGARAKFDSHGILLGLGYKF